MCKGKPRVVVAMSGGVDSSVAAAFLKQKGYDVIGMTMRFWGDENRCCSLEDLEDARQVARHLGIPHYVVSFHEAFKESVVDYFVKEYERGRTPNPCAVCNPKIKFGKLLDKASELGARWLATGHYAVISNRPDKGDSPSDYDNPAQNLSGRLLLKRGKERGKDQSYFLARLSQEALSRTLFPVGNFPKKKIRELAERFGLPVAGKKESQEVCFIPDGEVAAFVEEQLGRTFPRGSIVDTEGKSVGSHRGVIGYTIGQRKGLGIALGRPIYVTGIDAASNTIRIGDDRDLYQRRFIGSQCHWISIPQLNGPMQVKARIRYQHRPASAEIKPVNNQTEQRSIQAPLPDGNQSDVIGRVEVIFDRPQRAIAPGQLAVFYQDDSVVGSAWIDQVLDY